MYFWVSVGLSSVFQLSGLMGLSPMAGKVACITAVVILITIYCALVFRVSITASGAFYLYTEDILVYY